MLEVVRLDHVTRKFGAFTALDDISLAIAPGRIVGLIGKNGSGKTTLLRHIAGVYLPTTGECFTFGKPARELNDDDLARIGMVLQRDEFLTWMNVRELLSYVSAFYPTWDYSLQSRLLARFELGEHATIKTMSPGTRQRLSILLAVCHRPELILLDEPLSELDPLARETILQTLLDVFRNDSPTIIISSHLLHDIERIIDHVVCIDKGRLILDESLDGIHERFAEWTLTATNGRLPEHFPESWILSQSGSGARRQLIVTDGSRQLQPFGARYGVAVESRPMNLERVFTSITGGAAASSHADVSALAPK